jgi:pyridoxamine 5'-phosphate oxidase
MELSKLRRNYMLAGLLESEASPDPIAQFSLWFKQAHESAPAEWCEANAMTLATIGADGWPSARVVLLKGFDARGFVFFTNYESQKGREIEATGRAALVFLWAHLERQVRIVGTVARMSREESDAYFKTRPLGSRLGAWASPQSRVVPDRKTLEEWQLQYEEKFASEHEAGYVPTPPHWGGYRVSPREIEFWQGRKDRLHDRLRYTREGEGWKMQRLAP